MNATARDRRTPPTRASARSSPRSPRRRRCSSARRSSSPRPRSREKVTKLAQAAPGSASPPACSFFALVDLPARPGLVLRRPVRRRDGHLGRLRDRHRGCSCSAALAGLLAFRWLKNGSPPTPDLAIEEAKKTREELEHQSIERDQVRAHAREGRADLMSAEATAARRRSGPRSRRRAASSPSRSTTCARRSPS